ncbi:MAG: diguanylate cyclase [Sulfurimonadaceae bacterium]|nr:diguanylate cyclase [Sulfurimonadaceae bacterium]
MTINEIIKKTVERLKREGRQLTPDHYAEAFCEEARRAGVIVEDCKQVDKFLHTLDDNIQKEIKEYRLKTTQELVRFLISKLNRMKPSQSAQMLSAHGALIKRVLQAVEVLHNKEASALARKSIGLMENSTTPDQLEHLRQAWINFLTLYDDTYLEKLAPLGKIDRNDLKKSVENFTIGKGKAAAPADLGTVTSLLIASLVPSIASSVNDDIATLSDTLRNDPQMVTSDSIQQEIKNAIALRIALDKESLKEMVLALDTVLDKLSLQLIDLIERSDISTVEIQSIKKELESFEEEKQADFKCAHRKLYTIAVALEERTEILRTDLKEHSDEVDKLSARVNELEAELASAQQASHEDFLTKLYNRRAIDEHLKIKEGEFERYGRNFCAVFFDIDHFKQVNDTFGHEAGDATLSAFAKVLKQLCRNVDLVGRYGGEEFLALLSDTDLEGAVIFANKVREHVVKSRFMYKGERIEVTVSAGVAERKAFPSLKSMINSADQRLYDAKKNGRNRVEPQK